MLRTKKQRRLVKILIPNAIALILAMIVVFVHPAFLDSNQTAQRPLQVYCILLGLLILAVRQLSEWGVDTLLETYFSIPDLKRKLEDLQYRIQRKGKIDWGGDAELLKQLLETYEESALVAINELRAMIDFLEEYANDDNAKTFAGLEEAKLRVFSYAINSTVQAIS